MGKAADWLREERRKVLGDWVAFCLGCGGRPALVRGVRGRGGLGLPPPGGGVMLRRCPACDAPFSSTFAVECESCGTKLRENQLFGGAIRRAGR